jgi:NADH dehydrogenase [ubiquinone] 1 alpha subcomplex assembly factor 2
MCRGRVRYERRPKLPFPQELQGDEERRAKLTPLVQAIEAREHAERIRQGYIEAPGGAPLQISSERHAAMPPMPSSRVQAEIEALKRSAAVVEPAALPQGSEEVTPPAAPLDVRRDNAPASNDELRRLAEEDTKRRLKEMTGPPPAPEMPAAKEVDSWAPTRRRRGV